MKRRKGPEIQYFTSDKYEYEYKLLYSYIL